MVLGDPGDAILRCKAVAEDAGLALTALVQLSRVSKDGFIARLKSLGYDDTEEIMQLYSLLGAKDIKDAKAILEAGTPPAAPPEATESPTGGALPPDDPTGLAGSVVTIHGLQAKPELNGQRGRALKYDPKTGRLGVLIKDVGKLALKPSNLMSEADARKAQADARRQAQIEAHRLADEEAAAAGGKEQSGEMWTWPAVLRRLRLSHLRSIPFHAVESKLATLVDDPAAMDSLLAREGVEAAEERSKLVDELRREVDWTEGSQPARRSPTRRSPRSSACSPRSLPRCCPSSTTVPTRSTA